MIGSGGGAFTRGAGEMEDGVVLTEAADTVVGDAACNGRHASQYAFVEWPGEGG
ncbi:hypothetical protein D3C78_1774070 [compost metagenome]